MAKKRILGVIGLGHVGAHVAYALAVQGIADELILIDKNAQKLASEIQDLRDAAAYLPHRVSFQAGEFSDLGAHGKNISPEDARQLIFFTGGLMNTMIPEIDKIAAYAQGDTVTRADILAVAQRIPEAVVYELTDCLANQDYDGAMRILADLLADKSNTPIFLLAVIGQQMRRLYAARLARRAGIGTSELREMLGVPYDFIAENLLRSARKFTGRQLEEAVRLCAQADFAMKSSGADDMALLKELLLRIAVGGAA